MGLQFGEAGQAAGGGLAAKRRGPLPCKAALTKQPRKSFALTWRERVALKGIDASKIAASNRIMGLPGARAACCR